MYKCSSHGWAGTAHPHRTRDAKDGWRGWLVQDTPIERETRTTGGGGGWYRTPPSNARRERQEVVVAGIAHPHRTRDAKDGWRWWLVQYTPIEREMRTTGGDGGWRSTPPLIARCERYGGGGWQSTHPSIARRAR